MRKIWAEYGPGTMGGQKGHNALVQSIACFLNALLLWANRITPIQRVGVRDGANGLVQRVVQRVDNCDGYYTSSALTLYQRVADTRTPTRCQ